MKADSAGSVLLEPNPEQAVGRSQTNARSARGFQNLKLVPQRENLKMQSSAPAKPVNAPRGEPTRRRRSRRRV